MKKVITSTLAILVIGLTSCATTKTCCKSSCSKPCCTKAACCCESADKPCTKCDPCKCPEGACKCES